MITAVAIRHHNGTVYFLQSPNRHNNVIKMMVEDFKLSPPITGEQGFLSNDGKFLNRKQALEIAKKAGQIKEKHSPKHLLLSEDIW